MHDSPVHAAVRTYAASVGEDFDRCALGYAAGQALALSGNSAGALETWLAALHHPGAQGWPVLMNAVYEAALTTGAAAHTRDILDRKACELAELHLWSGLLSRSLGEVDRALTAFALAAEGTGELAFTAVTEQVRTLVDNDRLDRALAVCERAISRDTSGTLLLRTTRAGLLNRLGRPEDALVELDAVLAQAPRLAPAWLNRASALLRTGHKDAEDALHQAISIDPTLAPTAARLRESLG